MLKIKYRPSSIYIFLLLLLPIVDSLNGMINGGGNENGLSLGIVYRVIIVLVGFFYWAAYGVAKKDLLYLNSLFILFIFSLLMSSDYFSKYLIVLFKLLLPILIITTLRILHSNNLFDKKDITRIMDSWLLIFPLTLLITYFLGIGFNTYGNESVGFKGFYYAQNDISYVIDILYFYALLKVMRKTTYITVIEYLMVLVSALMLGLKNNYLIVIVLTLFVLLRKNKNGIKKLLFLITMIVGMSCFLYLFSGDLDKIIARWQYFYNTRSGFLSFFTSMRSDRVSPIFEWLKGSFGVRGILFGSGYNYSTVYYSGPFQIVEMDIFDIFFQIGIVGVVLIYCYYFKLFFDHPKVEFYSISFILTIVISTLSGHVLETALSGVFFAVICSGLVICEEKRGS